MGFGGLLKGALPAIGGVAGLALSGGNPAGAALGSGIGGALSAGLGAGQRSGGQYAQVDPNLSFDPAVQRQRGMMLGRLQDRAMGRGPSMADLQARQSLEQGRAQLMSQAVSDRRNPALAQRTAMLQGGLLSARIGQQAVMGRVAEQQAAEQALAQAVLNAQQMDNQRYNTAQHAMDVRYQGAMGQPTNFERASGVLASTLPMVGQLGQGGEPTAGETLKRLQDEEALRKYQQLRNNSGSTRVRV